MTPSPFSRAIRVAPLPQIFRHNLELTFYGDSDPTTYLVHFNTEMKVYQVPLPARCHLFVASLRGGAQKWFSNMGASSIRSWEQLADIFLRQFQSSLSYAPPVATLVNVKQGSEETLHDYFRRFNVEVPMDRGATDEAVKNFLIAGLRRGSDF